MRDFKNKYISVMGDSISTYEGYLPEGYPAFYSYRGAPYTGIYGYRDTWWGQVLEALGARLLVNNSWSGSYVCRPEGCETESYGCSDARSAALGREGLSPDHIIVFLGTNDRGAGFPLTSEDKSDISVIENAYRLMLEKLKRCYPDAEIWCCTFPVTTCSRNPYFEFPKEQRGIPMLNYCELVKRVSVEMGAHIIDLFDEGELCDTIDGLHPNYLGMRMIAGKVIGAMRGRESLRSFSE